MTKKMKITIVVAVVLCVAVAIVALAEFGGGGNTGGGNTGGGNTAGGGNVGGDGNGGGGGPADLGVYSITVNPAQPRSLASGQNFFDVDVYVYNYGQATSGSFRIDIWIKDLSRDLYYVCTQHYENPMSPGENRCVYSSTDRGVNDFGDHQVGVLITPSGEDADPSNNEEYYDFYVNY